LFKKVSTNKKIFYKLSSTLALPIPKKIIEEFKFNLVDNGNNLENENLIKILSFEKDVEFYSIEFLKEDECLVIKIKKIDFYGR
jgi:hypothetical protein